MLTYLFWTFAAAGMLAVLCYCAVAGLRDGDRPGDALVTAVLVGAGQSNTGQSNTGQPNTGQPNTGQPNTGQPNTGQPNTGEPEEEGRRITVTVRNPSGTPVLAALNARRALLPALLADPHRVRVPWRTRGRKFRPGRYGCVGVIPASGAAELAARAPARGRRYVLTIAVGQEGGRLRVHQLRLGPAGRASEGRQIIMVG